MIAQLVKTSKKGLNWGDPREYWRSGIRQRGFKSHGTLAAFRSLVALRPRLHTGPLFFFAWVTLLVASISQCKPDAGVQTPRPCCMAGLRTSWKRRPGCCFQGISHFVGFSLVKPSDVEGRCAESHSREQTRSGRFTFWPGNLSWMMTLGSSIPSSSPRPTPVLAVGKRQQP